MAEPSPQGPSAVVRQLKELWSQQSRGRRVLAIGLVLAIGAIVAISRLAGSSDEWSAVADGASPDDNQELLAVLEQRGLDVRLRDGHVEVPRELLDRARATAAAAGLPRVGKGFELFDGSHLGQSSFTEQVNFRRALQGELARSIMALAQVQGARVHLALGRRSVFKEQEQSASASVALHLHPGQTLDAEQVSGIRQLVAASVEGLHPESVVIVDHHGNLLESAEPTAAVKSAAIEQSVTSRVRSILERVVGPGKAWVVTTAVIDDRQVSETQEVFDHANPVLRSESRVVEGMDPSVLDGVGGVAGTRGNLPGATPAAGSGSATPASSNGRIQETKNFEISRTVRQVKSPEAQLAKLYLAIVVDYKTGPDGKPQPRTPEELAQLTSLARQAAGLDDSRGDKIDVRSIPFAADPDQVSEPVVAAPPVPLLPVPVPVAIGAGAGALVLLALAVLVLRRKRRRNKLARGTSLALPAPVADLERALDGREREALDAPGLPAGIESPALPPGGSTRDRVLAAVRSDIDRAAEVLTAWLSETPSKPTPTKGARS